MLNYQELANSFNFDDVFIRNLLLGFLKNFRNQIKWKNKFRDIEKEVIVPIYFSMTGDPRYLYDAFVDDPTTCRFDLDTPKIPSAIVTFEGLNIKSSQQTNPNVYAKFVREKTDSKELEAYYSKLKSIPITLNFKLSAVLDTEIDQFKYIESVIRFFYQYKFYTFMYNRLKVDAVFTLPDNFELEITKELTSQDPRVVKVSIGFEVQTYLPVFDGPNYDPNYLSYTDNDPNSPLTNMYNSDIDANESYLPRTQIGADKRMISLLHNIVDNINKDVLENEWIPDLDSSLDTDGDGHIDTPPPNDNTFFDDINNNDDSIDL